MIGNGADRGKQISNESCRCGQVGSGGQPAVVVSIALFYNSIVIGGDLILIMVGRQSQMGNANIIVV